jgi:hypothetical protein
MKILLAGFVVLATSLVATASEQFVNTKTLKAGSFKLTDAANSFVAAPQGFAAKDFTSAELQKYVDQLLECYDLNGNGNLNQTELLNVVKGTLFGGDCPNKPNSQQPTDLLTQTDLANLKVWFGNKGFTLQKLYSSSDTKCSIADLKKTVVGKSNLLVVSKTGYGKVLGGFTPKGVDSFSTYHFINDPDTQIFSFSSAKAYKILPAQASKALEIWTQTNWFIDFGYDALFWYDNLGSCIVRYDESTARTYFGSALDHAYMTGYTG